MTRRVIQLREWETGRHESNIALSSADRLLARTLSAGEGRLRVTEYVDSVRFDASAWVGVVRFTDVEVRVVPKLVGENLGVLRMLEYSSGWEALSRLESARTFAADRDGSLLDLLAFLLAESSIAIAKSGALHDYVTREETLTRIRGRLLPYEQIVRHHGQLDRLECRFDEFESNIPENQILAAALAIAKRVATDAQVRRLASRAHAIFAEVADPSAVSSDSPPIEYNRRNDHYRPAHAIAWMFLRNLSINDLYAPGSGNSFAFLLDMNRLFEDFVSKLLRDAFVGTDVRVRPQARDRTLLTDLQTGKPYAAVIPDILLERQGESTTRRVPVDAKYKLYDDRKLDQSDIYQTFFYAWAYHDRDAETDARSFILYPGSAGAAGASLGARARSGGPGARIRAIPIDVPTTLDAIRARRRVSIPEISEVMNA